MRYSHIWRQLSQAQQEAVKTWPCFKSTPLSALKRMTYRVENGEVKAASDPGLLAHVFPKT